MGRVSPAIPNLSWAAARATTLISKGQIQGALRTEDRFVRCRPWRAKRRPDARASDTPSSPSTSGRGAVRPPPSGARRDSAGARSGAHRGLRVVAERQAQGGLGRPVSHPEYGDTPSAVLGLGRNDDQGLAMPLLGANPVPVTDRERQHLAMLERPLTCPQQLTVRARIILLAGQGVGVRPTADALGIGRSTVQGWWRWTDNPDASVAERWSDAPAPRRRLPRSRFARSSHWRARRRQTAGGRSRTGRTGSSPTRP